MSSWPRQSLHEIADGIVAVVHGQGEVGVSNAVFITEGAHALVVDTMTFPEMAVAMAHEITRREARVETVLNTHHHIDHTGGNSVFADARIMAHPASIGALERLGLPAQVYDHLMPQFRGRFADLELRMPEALGERLWLPRGGELHIFTPAHTIADVTLWFPESRVLLTGDIGFFGVTPLAVNGLISGWLEALEDLIALRPATIVPGHGRIGTLTDLVTLRDYFAALYQLGSSAVKDQISLSDALATFDPGPLADWIEPVRHEINLERVMQEARGEISRVNLATMPSSALRT